MGSRGNPWDTMGSRGDPWDTMDLINLLQVGEGGGGMRVKKSTSTIYNGRIPPVIIPPIFINNIYKSSKNEVNDLPLGGLRNSWNPIDP